MPFARMIELRIFSKYFFFHSIAQRRILHFHRSIALRGTDVYQRDIFNAFIACSVKIPIKTPDVLLLRAVFNKNRIRVHMILAADGENSSLNIHDAFYHINVKILSDFPQFAFGYFFINYFYGHTLRKFIFIINSFILILLENLSTNLRAQIYLNAQRSWLS